jgi:ABC-type amino acid transport substrate-binding protein/mono/diheme cytochrome c family protein
MKMYFEMLSKAFFVSALAAAASASVPPTLAEEQARSALRLCADPDNLPFSSDDPARPGVYLEIGDAIAKALGRPVTHVWYRTYFGKRAVRVTMLAKQCDATIGLPDSDDFMGPKVIFSKPLFNLGYAIVAPKERNIASVEDLKGERVAVQFETEPQNIVGPRDDIEAVTVLSPDAGMKALADGRVDAAFLWAPTAGYLNKTTYDGRFAVVPVDGARLTYPAAIGYPKPSAALRDSIDAVLPEVSKTFPALFGRYGLGPEAPAATEAADKPAPTEKAALVVAQASPAAPADNSPPAQAAPSPPAAPTQTATSETGARDPGKPAGDGTGEFDVAPLAQPPTPEMIAAGKEVFNSSCAHCHGPDAVQAVKKIDLRRLTLRYGEGARNMYWKTVHEGRPAKGMPTWKDVFSDEQLEQVYAYLFSLQSKE